MKKKPGKKAKPTRKSRPNTPSPVNFDGPIVGRETQHVIYDGLSRDDPHRRRWVEIRATAGEIKKGYIDLPDGSFVALSGEVREIDGVPWAEVTGHYIYE